MHLKVYRQLFKFVRLISHNPSGVYSKHDDKNASNQAKITSNVNASVISSNSRNIIFQILDLSQNDYTQCPLKAQDVFSKHDSPKPHNIIYYLSIKLNIDL